MVATLAQINNYLKDQYLGQIRKIINFQVRTLKALKKGTKTWSGRTIQFPFHSRRSNSVMFGIGGEALPAARSQQTGLVTIPVKQVWGHVRLTHDAKKASRDGKGAFQQVLTFELKGMTQEIIDMCERSLWGDGTGKIAEVASFAGSTVTTSRMSDAQGSGLNGNADNRYIRVGMLLDFYTSGGVARKIGCEVTANNINNGTFTISGGTGSDPQDGDGVYIARPSGESPIGMEPMGLPGIIDNGTYVSTLHGVVRATYPMWNAQVINAGTFASPGAFNEAILQRALDAVDEGAGSQGGNMVMFAHHSTRREVLASLVPDRRFNKAHDYAAGFKEGKSETDNSTTLTYNEVPFVRGKYVPWRSIFGWHSEVAKFYEYGELEWIEDGGGNVLTLVPGSAGLYQAQCAWMYNVSTDDAGPNSSFRIDNIATTIDRVENA